MVVHVRYDGEGGCQRIRGRLVASHELEVAAERVEREVLGLGRVLEYVAGSDVEGLPVALLQHDRGEGGHEQHTSVIALSGAENGLDGDVLENGIADVEAVRIGLLAVRLVPLHDIGFAGLDGGGVLEVEVEEVGWLRADV